MHRTTDTAIVFCGELRTFTICSKTMKFLEQQSPKMDIYFSTSNITTTVNHSETMKTNSLHNRDTAGSEIKHMFNNCKDVIIHDSKEISLKRQGIPLIEHWRSGLRMIEKSGLDYGYVLMLRPDLFFSPNSFFDISKFTQYENAIGLSYVPPDEFIPDTILFSTYKNISDFIYGYDINKHLGGDQWHKYLYSIIKSLKLDIKEIPITGTTAIGRYGIEEHWTLDQVIDLFTKEMNSRE